MIKARKFLFALSALLLMTACAKLPEPPASSAPEAANTVPLSYTADYVLFEGGDTEIETKFLGLMDRDGRVILPAVYYGISVADNGLIFVETNTAYQMFDDGGKQIGKNYKGISFNAGNGEDTGSSVCGFGSQPTDAPSAPYIAFRGETYGEYEYWLLDETGAPMETEPYDDIEFSENGILKCRDGILYMQAADGTVIKSGGEVVRTLFGGKYLAKSYYINTHFTRLAIEDRDGNQILPAEYCYLDNPFEDRYVVNRGAPEFLGGAQAFLYDENSKLLADDSNHFSFTVYPDGSYVGFSYVGSPYGDYVEAVILDENGNPEPQGVYFIDKNGKRQSERYVYIEAYENDAALQKQAAMLNGDSNEILSRIGGAEALAKIEDAPGYGKTAPEEAFFLCQTAGDKAIKIPLRDVLNKDPKAK